MTTDRGWKRRISSVLLAPGMLIALSAAVCAAPLYHTISDSQIQGTYSADTFDANGFPVSLYWPDVGVLVYKGCAYEGSDLRCDTYDRDGNLLGETLIKGFERRENANPNSLRMATERVTPWWNRTAARATADVLHSRVQRSLFGVQPRPAGSDGNDSGRRERVTPPAPPETTGAVKTQPAEAAGRADAPALEPPLEGAPAGQPERSAVTPLPVEGAPAPARSVGGPGRIDLQPLEIVRAAAAPASGAPAAAPSGREGGRILIEPLQFISALHTPAPALADVSPVGDEAPTARRVVVEPLRMVRHQPTLARANQADEAAAPLRGMAAGDTEARFAVWLDGVLAQLENDDDETEFDGNLYLGMVGVDYRWGERVLAGVAAGYEYVDFDTDFNSGEMTARGLTVSPYAGVLLTPDLVLSAVSGLTFITGDQSRREPFAPVDAEFDALRFMIATDLSYRQAITEALHLTGSVGYMYATQHTDGFEPSEGTDVDSMTEDVGQIRAMLEGAYAIGRLEPYAKLAYLYDVQLSEDGLDRDEAWVAAGVSYRTGDRMRMDAEASMSLFREDYVDNRLRAGFRYEF